MSFEFTKRKYFLHARIGGHELNRVEALDQLSEIMLIGADDRQKNILIERTAPANGHHDEELITAIGQLARMSRDVLVALVCKKLDLTRIDGKLPNYRCFNERPAAIDWLKRQHDARTPGRKMPERRRTAR